MNFLIFVYLLVLIITLAIVYHIIYTNKTNKGLEKDIKNLELSCDNLKDLIDSNKIFYKHTLYSVITKLELLQKKIKEIDCEKN